jgi:2-phospho-L-lactate transferase/gluconeogenesis factor (CofD/UPF0052 family)
LEKRKVVVFGGGKGITPFLSLKDFYDLTVVTTMADNGGSSGKLREQNILAVGDFRRSLSALANPEYQLFTTVFEHRLMKPISLFGIHLKELIETACEELDYDLHNQQRTVEIASTTVNVNDRIYLPYTGQSHPIGNLLLFYLIKKSEEDEWVYQANNLLRTQGDVLPNTLVPCNLCVEFDGDNDEGILQIGESFLDNPKLKIPPIKNAWISPVGKEEKRKPVPCYGRVISCIKEADIITAGPGSLYPSVYAPFMSDGIREAIKARRINQDPELLFVLVANLVYDLNQTLFRMNDEAVVISPREQIERLQSYAGIRPDVVIAQDPSMLPRDLSIFDQYRRELGITDIFPSIDEYGLQTLLSDVAVITYDPDIKGGGKYVIRHDPSKLCAAFRHLTKRVFA